MYHLYDSQYYFFNNSALKNSHQMARIFTLPQETVSESQEWSEALQVNKWPSNKKTEFLNSWFQVFDSTKKLINQIFQFLICNSILKCVFKCSLLPLVHIIISVHWNFWSKVLITTNTLSPKSWQSLFLGNYISKVLDTLISPSRQPRKDFHPNKWVNVAQLKLYSQHTHTH